MDYYSRRDEAMKIITLLINSNNMDRSTISDSVFLNFNLGERWVNKVIDIKIRLGFTKEVNGVLYNTKTKQSEELEIKKKVDDLLTGFDERSEVQDDQGQGSDGGGSENVTSSEGTTSDVLGVLDYAETKPAE